MIDNLSIPVDAAGAWKSNKHCKCRMELVGFSPMVAEEWLLRARPNRQVVPNVVRQYARVMRAGGWCINGEPLIVNDNDELLNGQHRLLAVIEADVSVDMLVVRGVSNDSFPTIDTGRIRVGRDALSIHGFADPQTLNAAARWLWKYERSNGCLTTTSAHERPTNAEILELLKQHPDLPASVPVGRSVDRLLGRGTAAFCHYIFAMRDRVATDKFFDNLGRGENLREGQAIYVLREYLLANRQAKHKMSQQYQIALMIRGFNYERAGRFTKNIRWRQRGSTREAFPTLD